MSAYHIANNRLRTTRVLNVKTESSTIKTFSFNDELCARARPGQFLMLWVPGVDEIPFSIMHSGSGDRVTVAVKAVGKATQALHKMKAGQMMGVRGPFGNSFSAQEGKTLLIGGGTGVAPLLFLARELVSQASNVVFVAGAKTADELLYIKEIERLCDEGEVLATTEDGSYGSKCLATEPLEKLLAGGKFDIVYTCGPEQMMVRVFDLAESRGIQVEASLERLMRCAIGLCGSCVIGRYRVCRDGPVFSSAQLKEVRAEFGVSKLDFDGRRISV